MSSLLLSLAAEPASILYIATGAVTFAYAGLRKKSKSPVYLLFCRRVSRTLLESLHLL